MAKALAVSRKGDLIELDGGAFRLERVVLTVEGEARPDDAPDTYKVYRRLDTDGKSPDQNGVMQPTSYTYRYEQVGEPFHAESEEAAIDEAQRLAREG